MMLGNTITTGKKRKSVNLSTYSKCHERPLFLTEEDLKRHDDDDKYHAVREVASVDQNLQKEKNQNKELEAINYILTLLVRSKTKLEDQYDDMETKLKYRK